MTGLQFKRYSSRHANEWKYISTANQNLRRIGGSGVQRQTRHRMRITKVYVLRHTMPNLLRPYVVHHARLQHAKHQSNEWSSSCSWVPTHKTRVKLLMISSTFVVWIEMLALRTTFSSIYLQSSCFRMKRVFFLFKQIAFIFQNAYIQQTATFHESCILTPPIATCSIRSWIYDYPKNNDSWSSSYFQWFRLAPFLANSTSTTKNGYFIHRTLWRRTRRWGFRSNKPMLTG